MNHRWDNAWPVPQPPQGFADRVVGAALEQRRSRRRLRWSGFGAAMLSLLVAATAFAFVLTQRELVASQAALGAERAQATALAAHARNLEVEVAKLRSARAPTPSLAAATHSGGGEQTPSTAPAPGLKAPPGVAPTPPTPSVPASPTRRPWRALPRCDCQPGDSLCPCL